MFGLLSLSSSTGLTLAQSLGGVGIGLLVTLFVFLCVLMVLVVLIQRPQGGGLAGAFGGAAGSGQTAFGAKTGDALTIATISIFVVYILLAVGLNFGLAPKTEPPAGPEAGGATTETGTNGANGGTAPAGTADTNSSTATLPGATVTTTPAQTAPGQPAPATGGGQVPTADPTAPVIPALPGSTPVQPAPSQPAPSQPAPSQPAPSQPAPSQPAPTQPAPTQPAPATTPAPAPSSTPAPAPAPAPGQ